MRLFIAIHFSAEIKAAVAKIRDSIKDAAFRGNFTSDDNLHLTLVFLGQCDVRQTDAIKSVMDDTLLSECTLTLEKVGYFKRDNGNTWWVGLKANKLLVDLQADLTARLSHKGFMLESRKYTPHVTIGREVKIRAGFVQPTVQPISFNVTKIELMNSERINGKLTYRKVYAKNASINGGKV